MSGTQIALRVAAPLLLFLLLAAGWEWVALNLKSILPPLQSVAADMAARPGFYLSNLWVTVQAALAGFAIGGGLAFVLAVLVIHFGFLRSAVVPIALLLNVTPVVAISPALIVAFGFNAVPHIIVAAVSAFFPMLINSMTGLQAIDQQSFEVFRSMSASRMDILWRLRLPSSLPHLFAGARLSIAAAMVGSIVSEFMGTAPGIGAAIVISAISSLLLIGLVGFIERLVIRW